MKLRIVSAAVLAAGLAVGLSGCNLIAPQATLDHYAPSDGIDLTVNGVEVRDLLLIADESGENFNVVFTAVNTDSPQKLLLEVTDNGTSASASFSVPAGTTKFGDPKGKVEPVLLPLPGVKVGSTVTGYLSINGGTEVKREIPVLDGTLAEYAKYVLPEAKRTVKEKVDEAAKTAEEAAKAAEEAIKKAAQEAQQSAEDMAAAVADAADAAQGNN